MMKANKDDNKTEEVNAYMEQLIHPLQPEIEAVRTIIKNSHSGIKERIKWNAPSFFCSADMLTIHVKALDKVHLIFHHPFIVKINNPILEGDYKDRRMVYLRNMEEVKTNKQTLEQIMYELASKIESN